MTEELLEQVVSRSSANYEDTVELLCDYLRIPAISCEKHHAVDVAALCARVRDDLENLGLEKARILELEDALPAVAAEWMHAGSDKPTVLIYGHLDLQPVEIENWDTDPHEPVQKNGRLYARGAADDMGGWVSHMAALRAYFDTVGSLPCNIKLLIEGEEEIGSPNLERYMNAYPEVFESDVMVLTDCENPSPEVPGLTVSLRGLLEVELICEALNADVHSGLWGGMVPDASIALTSLISRLVDEDGRLKVGRVHISEERRKAAWDVPLSDEVIREGAHLQDGVSPIPNRGIPPAEWMWWQPALTIVATTMPSPERKKNALRTRASATLSIRLAPSQTCEEMVRVLEETLLPNPPGGVKVSINPEGWSGEGWLYTPKGATFEAADRAYIKSWGVPLVQVGVGGSIPFVALFGRRFGDLPLILNGVMDPLTTAHGPNESMHLGIFRKAIHANIYLLDELAKLGKQGLN
jgi:acetylornithine deacetylase/succinyl-diaminopimelate desuccinylase-like protein